MGRVARFSLISIPGLPRYLDFLRTGIWVGLCELHAHILEGFGDLSVMGVHFFFLPQDIIDYVLADFIGSVKFIARVDSATACRSHRPVFLSSMRALHNTEIRLYFIKGSERNANMMLRWMSSRNFAISKMTIYPIVLLACTRADPSASLLQQIVVRTLIISLANVCEIIKFTAEECRSMWSRFRWSELQWFDHDAKGAKLDELKMRLLPIPEYLTSIHANKCVFVGSSPRLLLTNHLKVVEVTVALDTFPHWVDVLNHSSSTLETLRIVFDSPGGPTSQYDGSSIKTSWPSLTSLKLHNRSPRGTRSDYDQVIVAFLQHANNLRSFTLLGVKLTHESATALLSCGIWRPRSHILYMNLCNVDDTVLESLPTSSSWFTDDPPITLWRTNFGVEESALWKYLPIAQQRFERILLDSEVSTLPPQCFEFVSEVDFPHSSRTVEQLNVILSSQQLETLRIDNADDQLAEWLKQLADKTKINTNKRKHTCKVVDISFSQLIASSHILDHMRVFFSQSLTRVYLYSVIVPFHSTVQFVAHCPKLKILNLHSMDLPVDVLTLQNCPPALNRGRNDATVIEVEALWPTCETASWTRFYECAFDDPVQERVFDAVAGTMNAGFRAGGKHKGTLFYFNLSFHFNQTIEGAEKGMVSVDGCFS